MPYTLITNLFLISTAYSSLEPHQVNYQYLQAQQIVLNYGIRLFIGLLTLPSSLDALVSARLRYA